MTPAHVEARYRNLLATIPRGHQASMNTMRELIDAAQLTRFERGEIWRYGVRHGYLVALNVRGEPLDRPCCEGAPRVPVPANVEAGEGMTMPMFSLVGFIDRELRWARSHPQLKAVTASGA